MRNYTVASLFNIWDMCDRKRNAGSGVTHCMRCFPIPNNQWSIPKDDC